MSPVRKKENKSIRLSTHLVSAFQGLEIGHNQQQQSEMMFSLQKIWSYFSPSLADINQRVTP